MSYFGDTKDFENILDVLNRKPDFREFTKSDPWKTFLKGVSGDYPTALRGKVFKLSGDVRSIHINQFNSISLVLTIDNAFDGLRNSVDVRVDVPYSMSDIVLNIRPDTGLKLEAVYKKLNVIVDTFELVRIVESNLQLTFPYCVCSSVGSRGCNAIFGYQEVDYLGHCPYCGSPVRKVYDMYTAEMQDVIRLQRSGR